MKKKVLSIMLTAALLLGAWATSYAGTDTSEVSFSDLKSGNWAYKYVSPLTQKGIVKGYSDGTFKPNNTVTYGEFIKLCLVAKTGEDIGNAKMGNWAKSYYDKALELGYFGETKIKESDLNKPIPRGDMALIVSSVLGDVKIENYSKLEGDLHDVNPTVKNDYDIIKSYATGVITGYEDNTFKPEKTLTRAESSTVAYRLIEESARVLPQGKKEELLTECKTSGTDIAKVIKNYRTYEQEKIDLGGKSLLAEATSYEFVTDMSGYKVENIKKNGVSGIKVNDDFILKLGWGNMYLMKNNEIVMMTQDGIYDDEHRMREHIDISTIEYFVFPRYKGVNHVIGIMPNPLYAGK